MIFCASDFLRQGDFVRIQYLGHSCFRLISDMGTTIVCDPFDDGTLTTPQTRVRCDVVTVSHHHHDHDAVECVLGDPAVLDVAVSCAADDVAIQTIETFHDSNKGAKRGKNLVFTFVIDGLKVAHLGDIGCVDDNVVSLLRGFDVILLPVGGVYTIDAKLAKWYVDALQPKVVIPMHYQTEQHTFSLGSLQQFTTLFDVGDVTSLQVDTLNLFDQPQNDKPQLIVLQRLED